MKLNDENMKIGLRGNLAEISDIAQFLQDDVPLEFDGICHDVFGNYATLRYKTLSNERGKCHDIALLVSYEFKKHPNPSVFLPEDYQGPWRYIKSGIVRQEPRSNPEYSTTFSTGKSNETFSVIFDDIMH